MWSKDRKDELKKLQQLLQDAQCLNSATGALDRLARINKLANELLEGDLDTGRSSFGQFLVEQANMATAVV